MKKQDNVTLESISKHLNLSMSTVSRALNGQSEKYRISKKTTTLILEAAKEFKYEPNQLARGLRLQKTNTIGVIIPDITNPFFSKIVRWIENAARDNGVSILISDSNEKTEFEKSSVQLFANRKIDGMIISPVGEESEHLINAGNNKIPIVLIDRLFNDLNFPFVGSNNYEGAKEAISYLISNGHKRIGFIQGIRDTSVNQARLKGYKESLTENNIPLDSSLIVGNSFGEENGYIEAKLLLNSSKKITAIFAASNLIALGAIKAISEENLKIPEDISLISFDDQPYSGFLSTPMTTVAQQGKEIGTIAFKLLTDMIQTGKLNNIHKILLPTKLIIRDSVRNING
jgi:LacI family transcriptional regulator